MPRHPHIPDFYCYNCDAIIDVRHPAGCCEKCNQNYSQSFEFVANQTSGSNERKGWAFYLLAKSFADDTLFASQSVYFDQMIKNYWNSAFLGNYEAKRELANLFADNDDELSLLTTLCLVNAHEGDWEYEYLKKIRETDSKRLFEIAQEFEKMDKIPNHREYAYKFYRRTIESKIIVNEWKFKAIINLVQMLLFDKYHHDDMFLQKNRCEPQLGAEIAFWLEFAKQYDNPEAKDKVIELYQKTCNYFKFDTIVSKFFRNCV